MITRSDRRDGAFSLVEVVLALGVIGFAVLAILGVIPIGLNASHSAQDETRAAQVATTVFSSFASQAPNNFTNVKVPLPGNNPPALDLSSSTTSPTSPAATIYANNDGVISQSASGAIYSVAIATNSSPLGFDPGYANQVTVRVSWPASAPASNQTYRDYVRIISKY
ncbi:MAG: type IV pilus modification PilV family protein [Chthoniobacterales bacterium]